MTQGPGGDSHQHAGKWARSAKPGGPVYVACQIYTEKKYYTEFKLQNLILQGLPLKLFGIIFLTISAILINKDNLLNVNSV